MENIDISQTAQSGISRPKVSFISRFLCKGFRNKLKKKICIYKLDAKIFRKRGFATPCSVVLRKNVIQF